MSPAGLALEAIIELTIGLLRRYRSDEDEEDADDADPEGRNGPLTPSSDGTGPPYPPDDGSQSASSGRARR